MSQYLKRALRRQQAIQESRSAAWVLFAIVVPVSLLGLVSLLLSVIDGAAVSLSGIASLLLVSATSWIAGHLYREARRLGRLLRDPETIMRADQSPDLYRGLDWSGINPFSGWRG